MRTRSLIIALAAIALITLSVQWCVVRWDITKDQRYTLSEPTKALLAQLDEEVEAELLLNGPLNSGFTRLRKTCLEMLEDMRPYATIRVREATADESAKSGLVPTLVHERTQDGRTAQTEVYPYLRLTYKHKQQVVSLLRNNRGKSGEENLNSSIEGMEYAIAEAIHTLVQEKTERVAFLEGHGELNEKDVWDWSQQLSRYFQIDRGQLGNQTGILDPYKVVIIAGPQLPFSDIDKYIIDQYIMQGGLVLWLVDGVRFSDDMLSQDGITPVIGLDLNLSDMWFRYGVRENPVLLQDLQCLRIPVNVGMDGQENFQPIPWTYAPLLLTSQASPVTRDVMQVSTSMHSTLDIVGGEDGLEKDILLATSSASRVTGTPAEVDLSDLTIRQEDYRYQFLPAAMSVSGIFTSLYAHLMPPENIVAQTPQRKQSVPTKQIFVAGSNLARNEWEKGQPLPVGFDRYTQTQFGNRDFLVNAVLYLSDDSGIIQLREKSITLRLLNDQRAHTHRLAVQLISTCLPLLLLCITGMIVLLCRKKRYTK